MAPRASFISPETGSDVDPSTTCTVTGIDRIAPRLGAPAIGSNFAASTAMGGSEVTAAASMKGLAQWCRSHRRPEQSPESKAWLLGVLVQSDSRLRDGSVRPLGRACR